jgi:diacylglycerol kinase (ATP)
VVPNPRLIVNPAAGSDSGSELLSLINRRLRSWIGMLDIAMTTGEGDAVALARQAAEDGCEQLFVAGGDGTLNEALNGVASVPHGLDAVTFGVIPLGTGNDFATALGIPDDVEGALQALRDGVVTPVDVGCLNDRRFVNVSAGGFLAEVSTAASERLKTLTGRLAYLIGGAQVLLEYEPVPARVRVDGADRDWISLHAFAVCNSRLVGGGRLIAPDALIDDGWLDVCLIQAMPTIDFIALLTSVSGGAHVHDERVAYFRARDVQFELGRATAVNTDGQVLEATRCDYRVLPRAARFRAPRAS